MTTTRAPYTTAIGEAGEDYIKSVAFKGEHHLPAQFRWHELWGAMNVAALSTPATEPQGYVVKPLVWEQRDQVHPQFKAVCALGTYYIERNKGGLFEWWSPAMRGKIEVRTLELAQAAANADRESRILSALAARPAPQPAADTRLAGCEDYQPSANPMDQGDCARCGNSRSAHAPSDKIAEAARVKPLVWENNTARDLYGDLYEIEGTGPFEIEHPRLFNAYYRFPSIEAAQAAAQADHEARVLSALAGQGETP